MVTARGASASSRPGEGTFEPDGVLPRSTHYLVHPVLSQIIARLNHGYAERIDA